ncbi:MAG: hypothetical protein PHV34_14955 [Verrucomicrobiae bacterium]|nr:hypothetical protein [Verrucomicrobiae bacterium]
MNTALVDRVTLEVSLKPFKVMNEEAIRAVCVEMFRQWDLLIRQANTVSVLVWSADGSEILDYRGRLDDEMEWARYIGVANPPKETPWDPQRQGLHARNWLYVESPPRITYRWLKFIVQALREVGQGRTGKPVEVGATFDPGPEFARSTFKYVRHREISTGHLMGDKTWVNCVARLKADQESYAGFPGGIPEGTPFGVFLGRQSQRFLSDLGFDYLWFSNGFGYALCAWSSVGEVFDGTSFSLGKAAELRADILSFWKLFRGECPRFRLETRGTNLSTAMDLSAHGSPVKEIYECEDQLWAPPNSPWAALDGDYGLEIVGYLSHIAALPKTEKFPYRYYLHDPWWLNSPWFDRYGREPHDIYLPLALARVDQHAGITRPSAVSLLTIDNSFGEMPEEGPLEVVPHLLTGLGHFSDAPGLVTWIYPFSEYHEMTFGASPRIDEVFLGDWFMRGAVNHGFPLNTVVSTGNFIASLKTCPDFYRETILATPVPAAGSPLEKALLDLAGNGHRIVLYGPVTHAGKSLLRALNLRLDAPVSGQLAWQSFLEGDFLDHPVSVAALHHRTNLSGGGIDSVMDQANCADWQVCATVADGNRGRIYSVMREFSGGNGKGCLAWVRGSFNCHFEKALLPIPDDPEKLVQSDLLMRHLLARMGCVIRFQKESPAVRDPLLLAARHRNGFFFSGYTPSTTVSMRLKFPWGAPLLVGYETRLRNGHATYAMPRAWHRECRCFVEQAADTIVSCVEHYSCEMGIRRRLLITGLQNATVTFFPETPIENQIVKFQVMDNSYLGLSPHVPHEGENGGRRLVARKVNDRLLISWGIPIERS